MLIVTFVFTNFHLVGVFVLTTRVESSAVSHRYCVLHSLSFIVIVLQSLNLIVIVLQSLSFIVIVLQSLSSIVIVLHSLSFIVIVLHSLSSIVTALQSLSFTVIVLQSLSFIVIVLHSLSFTIIGLYSLSFIIIGLYSLSRIILHCTLRSILYCTHRGIIILHCTHRAILYCTGVNAHLRVTLDETLPFQQHISRSLHVRLAISNSVQSVMSVTVSLTMLSKRILPSFCPVLIAVDHFAMGVHKI